MNILTQYFLKMLIPACLVVFSIYAALDFFISFMGIIKGHQTHTMWYEITQLLLVLPNRIYHFSPLLLMLGSFIAQAMIAHQMEWIALKSLGLSLKKAIQTLSLIGAFFMLLNLGIGEFLATNLEQLSIRIEQEQAEAKMPMTLTEKGFWLRQGNLFWHIAQLSQNELRGITIYEFEKDKLIDIRHAHSAVVEGKTWILRDVNSTHFSEKITSAHKKYLSMDAPITQETLKPYTERSESTLRILDLWRIYQFQRINHLNETATLIALLQRFLNCIFILLFTVFPLRFVLGLPRHIHLGRRVLFGVVTGFLFYALVEATASYIFMLHVPAFLGISLPILGVGVAIWLYFYRWGLMSQ